MEKRELSATLKNLKFMQRGLQRELKPEGCFASSSSNQIRKCVVIMEGNSHPGVLKGRMSFQSYNPSIDKLNEESANPSRPQVPSTSSSNGGTNDREKGTSGILSESDSKEDHKRKHTETEDKPEPQHTHKSQRNVIGERHQQSKPNNRKDSNKQRKQENKLNWKLLRPQKAQNRLR